MTINTPRLLLRQWNESDLAPFIQMGQDPDVMRFFPSVLTQDESEALMKKIMALIDENGWGFWAVEIKETKEFIGFVGLNAVENDLPCTPFIEIGWRINKPFWGQGFAPEAAKAALEYAFTELNQKSVYAFTAKQNSPSRRVMSKIGMVNTRNDFDHPKLPDGHILQRHCLYCIGR
ncbi:MULTISPECIES: GNAT family N-acetyltransferase [Vibrio]|uniref:N-acetyltransferase n=1 Tax=Vibrio casei TaxID=673372 RepID=A0A368LN65_9VIBR|nr:MULTISPECIES: GNAT family N-acetyltransferase [Vibrio]RCS73278.1 N-acetyltransferase [Vibrio casei]SJN18308.1 Protein export cytoplasm protein SecA ATPase RNA helicase (TC 3.A.5.1.1) [Vibrio casei]HBV75745.1 N-acetyltransferase [Vibrio sp.]